MLEIKKKLQRTIMKTKTEKTKKTDESMKTTKIEMTKRLFNKNCLGIHMDCSLS